MCQLSVVPQETSDSRTLGRKVYIRCFFNLNLFKVCVYVCVCMYVYMCVCVCVCVFESRIFSPWSFTKVPCSCFNQGKQGILVLHLIALAEVSILFSKVVRPFLAVFFFFTRITLLIQKWNLFESSYLSYTGVPIVGGAKKLSLD